MKSIELIEGREYEHTGTIYILKEIVTDKKRMRKMQYSGYDKMYRFIKKGGTRGQWWWPSAHFIVCLKPILQKQQIIY